MHGAEILINNKGLNVHKHLHDLKNRRNVLTFM